MEISYPESGRLVVDGCRRLTGPSLVWNKTGAILDLLIKDIDSAQVLDCWQRQIGRLLDELAWPEPELTHRRFENGFSLLLAAPVDQLYAAVGALETAWYFSACELLGVEVENEAGLLRELAAEMQAERNQSLLALQAAAAARGVDFLIDDDIVFVGRGTGCKLFDIDRIPPVDAIDWSAVQDIPVVLVTGTNGKSTCVRLLDGIARAAGKVSGITSTDFVRVGDRLLDRGDYSGPGGARLLLRDPDLEVAFLEVARGGILRRGLAVQQANAALITNVASDHLGQYGVNTLAALTETKFVVRRGLADDAPLVVNADDAGIVEFLADDEQSELCWFSLDRDNPVIQRQMQRRGRCCFLDDGYIVSFDGVDASRICSVDAIPMTLGGAARHNVQNALAAAGVAATLGYDAAQISEGLGRFHSDERDNPGRLNLFELGNSARAIVDFAHNAHGVAAVVETARRMPARRKWALFGSAGDRSDSDIEAIARGICMMEPDTVVITELEIYLRGRNPGEVSAILQRACLEQGLAAEQIHIAGSPLDGVSYAVERMQAQDLGLFLVLTERDEVIEYLRRH